MGGKSNMDEYLILLKSYEQTLESSLQLVRHQIRLREGGKSLNQTATTSDIHPQIKYNSFKNNPNILTAKEIAEILQVSRRKAYEIMELKSFPLVRIGRSKRVSKEKFFEWISHQEKKSQ
jgi:excisionase family DNA binding protein